MFDRIVLDADKYDHLIVGAGLYGAVMARELTDRGFSVLVIEKRDHTGGNAYTADEDGIIVHKYGPHVFHTDNEEVWRYVNRFADFKRFVNRPAAVSGDRTYTLPVCMDTFREMWGVTDPEEAKHIIRSQAEEALGGRAPSNLEEQAISMFGTDIYEKIIKGYSEKQWGRSCRDLPASIVKRMTARFGSGSDYYGDRYQGVPIGGYTPMIEKMLEGAEVITGLDYDDMSVRAALADRAEMVIYTGSPDAYYGYCFGRLEYRSLRFEEEKTDGTCCFQDRAVVNFTDAEVPYTRITEHKYFEADPAVMESSHTIITREYPQEHDGKNEPLYPVCDEVNMKRYEKYMEFARHDKAVHFGGRLGSYRYLDMDDVIASALADAAMLAERK